MPINLLIEKAFDYRGDVTFDLQGGASVEGFIFNRDPAKKIVQIFVKGEPAPKQFSYSDITDIRMTGENTAAGKSWEDWKAKQAKKE